MSLKQLKRDLSLSKLGFGELTGRSKVIIDFLNEKLTSLNQYTSDDYNNYYTNYLFFGKSKENIVLEFNKENGDLYVSHDEIWSLFVNDLSMEYTDMQEIIQWWAVDTLKLKVNYIQILLDMRIRLDVDRLKLKVNHII